MFYSAKPPFLPQSQCFNHDHNGILACFLHKMCPKGAIIKHCFTGQQTIIHTSSTFLSQKYALNIVARKRWQDKPQQIYDPSDFVIDK